MNDLKNEDMKLLSTNEYQNNQLTEKREKWTEEANKKITITDICPTCNRALEPCTIQATIEKSNSLKSKLLEKIKTDAENIKNIIKDINTRQSGLVEKIKNKQDEINTNNDSRTLLEIKHAELKRSIIDDIELSEFNRKLESLKSDLGLHVPPDFSEQEKRISEINSKIEDIQKINLDVKKNITYEQRVDALVCEQNELARELVSIASTLSDIEKFMIKKVKLTEDKINEKFELCNFKMFEKKISGICETCETTVEGVPYSLINTAAETQAGIDIISTLQKINNINAPIFIDNRESVTKIPQIDNQIISMYVSHLHNKLMFSDKEL